VEDEVAGNDPAMLPGHDEYYGLAGVIGKAVALVAAGHRSGPGTGEIGDTEEKNREAGVFWEDRYLNSLRRIIGSWSSDCFRRDKDNETHTNAVYRPDEQERGGGVYSYSARPARVYFGRRRLGFGSEKY
jgi:hypothetical protein